MPSDFKKLMSARFFFTLGVQMQAIVLGWTMYDLTKDALYLGLIGLMEAIPALSLALFAGHIVDRNCPKIIYQRVLLISLTSALLLLFTQYFNDTWELKTKMVLLFSSSFLTGCARAFSQPSIFALVPKLIPKNLLSISSTWMTSAMQTARMTGPALGGIAYGFFGAISTNVIICLCLLCAALSLKFIYFKSSNSSKKSDLKIKDELLSGAKFVFTHPLLLPAMTLDMVSVFFGGVTALLPIYAAEILHVGPQGLGILRASPAIGAFFMSTLLLKTDLKTKSGSKFLWAVTGFGASILVFALSKSFLLSLFALALSGAFDSVSMVIRTTLVQLLSPDEMRGRISAVNSMFIGSSNELGEFESGLAVKFLGLVPAAVFGGIMCLTTVGIVAFVSPALRKLDLVNLEK
jgi:MFS family permease